MRYFLVFTKINKMLLLTTHTKTHRHKHGAATTTNATKHRHSIDTQPFAHTHAQTHTSIYNANKNCNTIWQCACVCVFVCIKETPWTQQPLLQRVGALSLFLSPCPCRLFSLTLMLTNTRLNAPKLQLYLPSIYALN